MGLGRTLIWPPSAGASLVPRTGRTSKRPRPLSRRQNHISGATPGPPGLSRTWYSYPDAWGSPHSAKEGAIMS